MKDFARFLRRWCSGNGSNGISNSRNAYLELETLEKREVPAAVSSLRTFLASWTPATVQQIVGGSLTQVSGQVRLASWSAHLSAGSNPPVANSGPDAAANEGSVIQFNGTASGAGALGYSWNFGDGTTTSGTLTPTHQYADDRTYTVSLTVVDSMGRIARDTMLATVGPVAPTATLSNNGPVLPNKVVTIKFSNQFDPSSADKAAGFRYSYDFNNDGTFEITNSLYSYAYRSFSTPGEHVVRARIADVDGAFTVYTTTVTVAAPNGPIVDAGADRSGNVGSAVSFSGNASGSAPLTYQWTFGDGGSASGTLTPSHTYASKGTFTVTLTVTDALGRTARDTVLANVSPVAPVLPVANAGADVLGKEGSVVQFKGSATGVGTLKYSWNFGDGTTASDTLTPSHKYADDGIYTAILTVTDSSGQIARDMVLAKISSVAPIATLSNNGPVLVNSVATIRFSNPIDPSAADTAAGFRYSYDFNNDGTFDVINSLSISASKSFMSAGSYVVKGRIADIDGAFTDYQTTVTVTDSGTTGGGGTTGGTYAGLTIPVAHARLWFTPERLAQAKQYFAQHPFTPRADDPQNNALRYLLTGDVTNAQTAINWLMSFTISDDELAGVASDHYRWSDWIPLVFDWCYDQMTPTQRSTFIDRYNNYTSIMMGKSWGGVGMDASNYYWGVWRNELNWAIATYYENTAMAQKFIDDALVTRWKNDFLPWANSYGAGGVQQEGSGYGQTQLQYPIGPIVTASLEGRNLLAETNFFTAATYDLIYATSTGPVAKPNGTSNYQLFPFNDDESGGFPQANTYYRDDYMTAMAGQTAGTPLAGYIRQWLANVGGGNTEYYMQATDNGGAVRPFTDLPTDYYAPGAGFLYAKSDWSADAMSLNFQLGGVKGVGHSHQDSGTFQILRGGQWVTKESTGYATSVVGYGGVGTVSVASTLAHNGLLVNGRGQLDGFTLGPPQVGRMESRANYTFASVDLTPVYRSTRDVLDNPAVGSVVRDFVYVRDLDALIVLDRMDSTSTTDTKTFLLHFPNNPTISGNTVVGVNGDQALKLTTLTPAGQSAPSLKVINETTANPDSSTDYQYRLEETTTGQAQSYMINVIQARDATGSDLAITMTEDASSFTITLKDPTTGKTAVVNLAKGMTSTGGSFGYSPTGTPTQSNLTNTVQGIQATENGVVWS
jgi:PKD repeat protein